MYRSEDGVRKLSAVAGSLGLLRRGLKNDQGPRPHELSTSGHQRDCSATENELPQKDGLTSTPLRLPNP